MSTRVMINRDQQRPASFRVRGHGGWLPKAPNPPLQCFASHLSTASARCPNALSEQLHAHRPGPRSIQHHRAATAGRRRCQERVSAAAAASRFILQRQHLRFPAAATAPTAATSATGSSPSSALAMAMSCRHSASPRSFRLKRSASSMSYSSVASQISAAVTGRSCAGGRIIRGD